MLAPSGQSHFLIGSIRKLHVRFCRQPPRNHLYLQWRCLSRPGFTFSRLGWRTLSSNLRVVMYSTSFISMLKISGLDFVVRKLKQWNLHPIIFLSWASFNLLGKYLKGGILKRVDRNLCNIRIFVVLFIYYVINEQIFQTSIT